MSEQWEYKEVPVYVAGGRTAEELNKYGWHGWELVSVCDARCYLKRAIERSGQEDTPDE